MTSGCLRWDRTGVEVKKREFLKVGTLASPYAGKWSKSVFPKRWMSRGWIAATALDMRCAGYTVQEVINELCRHILARPNGQSRDERIEYGRRGVWYAFGTAGDIDIVNSNPTSERIQKFNRIRLCCDNNGNVGKYIPSRLPLPTSMKGLS